VGVFAFGYASPKSLMGVFSCPDKQLACIVSAGAGYLVRVDAPDTCDEIRSYPIVEARPILDRELLIFVDFSTLIAYGPKGIVWLADGRSWDGIEIIETTSDWIRGRAWDPPHQKYVEFLVDVETGALRKDSPTAK
jgi:hypothetical protein